MVKKNINNPLYKSSVCKLCEKSQKVPRILLFVKHTVPIEIAFSFFFSFFFNTQGEKTFYITRRLFSTPALYLDLPRQAIGHLKKSRPPSDPFLDICVKGFCSSRIALTLWRRCFTAVHAPRTPLLFSLPLSLSSSFFYPLMS